MQNQNKNKILNKILKNLNSKIHFMSQFLYNKSKKQILRNFYHNLMLNSSEEDNLIKQQQNNLLTEKCQQNKKNQLTYKNLSLWSDANYKPTKIIENNRHNFSIYADKLLIHLVVQVKFDFTKIAQIMSYTFRQQQNQYTEQICRQRWHQLHRDRHLIDQIKEKEMQNKRVKSIMSMNDPFMLYNIGQKLQKMQKQQQNVQNKQKQMEYKHDGYNIFKDSIRKIDDIQKYNELQKHMKEALGKASKQVQLQKPMLYTPYYDRLQQFQVQEQQLTLQRMQQLMSHPIEMELMQRQLKSIDLNERGFESRIKKETEKRGREQRIRKEEQFEIEENWDEYESD